MLTLLKVALVLEGGNRSFISAQDFKGLVSSPHWRHVAVLALRHPVDATPMIRVLGGRIKVLDWHTPSPHVHFMSLRCLFESLIPQRSNNLINFTDLSVKVFYFSVLSLSIRRFVGFILL